MRHFIFDVTICLSIAGDMYVEYFEALAAMLVAGTALGRVERWRAKKQDYMRIVWVEEAPTMLEAVVQATQGIEENRPADVPPAVVSWAARALEHDLLASLPPYQAS